MPRHHNHLQNSSTAFIRDQLSVVTVDDTLDRHTHGSHYSLVLTFVMWNGGGHNAVLRNDVHE